MTNPVTKPYKRKLSAIERYNLVINGVLDYNVTGFVEGVGNLNVEQWRRAVAIAAEANPGVRVRLRGFLGFCKWVDSGINPEVEEIQLPHWNGTSNQGFDLYPSGFKITQNSPVVDIKLLRGSPARVIFRGLHGAVDARGMVHFMLDVIRVLRGEEPIGSPSTIIDADIRAKHQDKVTAPENDPIASIPAMSVSDQIPAPTETPEYLWRRVRINNSVKNIMPKMALFLAQQARSHAEGSVSFTVPVDFRGLRETVNSTANLTGYLRVVVDEGMSARDIMKQINQQIRGYADCRDPGDLRILPWLPINFMSKQLAKRANELLHTTNEGLPTGGLVSLGHFDAQAWSYSGFQASSVVGIPGSVGKLNVLMQNFSDFTEVILSTPKDYNSKGQLDNLIERLQAHFNLQE